MPPLFCKKLMAFLFFILAFVSIPPTSATIWEDLSIDGPEADTGYPACVLDYIYIRYHRQACIYMFFLSVGQNFNPVLYLQFLDFPW